MVDEFQVQVNAEHIREAQEGNVSGRLLFRRTLPPGYTGEPVPGKSTEESGGRLAVESVIDPTRQTLCIMIFEWYVNDRAVASTRLPRN